MWRPDQAPQETLSPLNPIPAGPRPGHHRRPMTAASSPKAKAPNKKKILISILIVLFVLAILVTAAFFIKKLIASKYFFCSRSVKFIPLSQTCDGKNDCSGGEDELTCLALLKDNTTFPVRLYSDDRVLQVYSKESKWRTVCSDEWTSQHTETACKQLGYTKQPKSTSVTVSKLVSPLKTGLFTAVRSGTTGIPIHQATQDRSVCKSGSVISLSCSDCGEVPPDTRVVGGKDTEIQFWPWQVSLRQNGQHSCGGSLVSSRWVISAAHCFPEDRRELSLWTVMSGKSNINALGGSSVDRIIVHGKYDSDTNDYDIAMLRLSSPIAVSSTQKPVCLPPKAAVLPDNAQVHVTGWGLVKEEGQVSQVLQEATIKVIPKATCSSSNIYSGYLTERMLCAGELSGGVDACQGDSGGPLVYSSGSSMNLVGVVSWGVGCARANRPGVYTDVEEVLNWIYTVTEQNP